MLYYIIFDAEADSGGSPSPRLTARPSARCCDCPNPHTPHGSNPRIIRECETLLSPMRHIRISILSSPATPSCQCTKVDLST